MTKVDPTDYPHLIKDGSNMFLDLKRQSMLTAKTVYNAMGLNTSKAMKLHFRQYVQELLHPDNNSCDRYSGISTLINIIMPALLPSCAVIYEEGCRFLDGKNRKKLLCSSQHWIIRHHHTTKEKQFQCNTQLNNDYNNIVVIGNDLDDATLVNIIRKCEALRALVTMRIVKSLKCWYLGVSENNICLIETTFQMSVWKNIWRLIAKYYDNNKPKCPNNIGTLKKEFYPILEEYINSNSKCIVELPRLKDYHGSTRPAEKFSPYHMPVVAMRSENTVMIDGDFEALCCDLADIIEEGYNFLRVEVSEIIAFVATNSSRVVQPGIPPHLPIAYGLRGHSLSMETMRNMVNDVCTELKDRNTSVLCEVYDGQFHKLNVRSDCGHPLTHLQQRHDHFSNIMNSHEQLQLINKLLAYAEISPKDLESIRTAQFKDNTVIG